MLTLEYPVVSSNLKSGLGVFGTADPYDTTKLNSGARNPVGGLAFFPAPSTNGGFYPSTNIGVLPSAAGYCSGLLCRYVLFRSTTNTAMVAGAAPVFYTDETLGIVTGTYAESGMGASSASAAAGWLPLNTATTAYGLGTAVTAAILNNGGVLATGVGGSYVWIILAGFIPNAWLAAGAIGNVLTATGNWATTGIAAGSNVTNRPIGYVLGAVTSNVGDVMAATSLIF